MRWCPDFEFRGDIGYECPAGFYCPAGTEIELPCPLGTFSQALQLSSVGQCTNCPEDTYSDTTGSIGCKICGSSSEADPRSSVCTCEGENRAFQASDGSCLCKAGFVFFDEAGAESTSDSKLNCQEKIFPRCAEDEVYGQNGDCIQPEGYDCSVECPVRGPVLQFGTQAAVATR